MGPLEHGAVDHHEAREMGVDCTAGVASLGLDEARIFHNELLVVDRIESAAVGPSRGRRLVEGDALELDLGGLRGNGAAAACRDHLGERHVADEDVGVGHRDGAALLAVHDALERAVSDLESSVVDRCDQPTLPISGQVIRGAAASLVAPREIEVEVLHQGLANTVVEEAGLEGRVDNLHAVVRVEHVAPQAGEQDRARVLPRNEPAALARDALFANSLGVLVAREHYVVDPRLAGGRLASGVPELEDGAATRILRLHGAALPDDLVVQHHGLVDGQLAEAVVDRGAAPIALDVVDEVALLHHEVCTYRADAAVVLREVGVLDVDVGRSASRERVDHDPAGAVAAAVLVEHRGANEHAARFGIAL
mmetsp:Transcript_67451/g.186043  ORF Transcript_67451/g.186043 Transcript_67451/m.186043 type:complete len:365 (+) Transcript_67451:3038-4132(+)